VPHYNQKENSMTEAMTPWGKRLHPRITENRIEGGNLFYAYHNLCLYMSGQDKVGIERATTVLAHLADFERVVPDLWRRIVVIVNDEQMKQQAEIDADNEEWARKYGHI